MPKGKSRKFIDKKNSVTFHLVHRSQKDPLAADETAPQRVLVPLNSNQSSKHDTPAIDIKKRKEEEQKYGIFFDDDYDYLQHLRDVNTLSTEWERVETCTEKKIEKPKINLPSSVFESHVEEKIGLLNKAAPISGPRLELDPDIVAAMDDDFDYDDPDNKLDDNFMELAMAGKSDDGDDDQNEEREYYLEEYEEDTHSDASSTGHMALSDEEKDEVGSLNESLYTFKDEEVKSRFTSYSMSSSVIRRNEQLTLLDDKFERVYADYDDTEIGALDAEEIEGYVNPDSNVVLQYAKEFEKQKHEDTENLNQLMKNRMKITDADYSSSEDENDFERLEVNAREKEKWDCESIISTNSNIYNHPKLISEPKGLGKIKIDSKTGIPKDIISGHAGKLTAKNLAQFDLQNQSEKSAGAQSIAETMKSTLSILSVRPKNESSDERKARKKALKEYRKERRIERKANTEAFKEEKKKQEKILLNNKQNIQGNRIL